MDAQHPSDSTLRSFHLGQLDAMLAAAVAGHLSTCSDCRSRMSGIPSESLPRGVQSPRSGSDLPAAIGSSLTGLHVPTAAGSAQPTQPDPVLDALLSHPDYRVIRELGRGGMGVVYLAENRLMGRKEVLKVVSADVLERNGVLDRFLREFPETPRRTEVLALARSLKNEVTARKAAVERRLVDELVRSESLPGASYTELIERARQFLADHPDSNFRGEVQGRIDDYVRKLDERDIERAREYSRRQPSNFAARIERFQDYLKGHQAGGQYLSEAMEARDRILREWDIHAYRQAYDHWVAHPDDPAEVARRLRDYLRDHPDGTFVAEARTYLDWWDRVSVPGKYRVTLRRGQVESSVGKYLSGGAPDLGVVLEVAGVVYGPSPVIKDSHRPIWGYTFPRPVVWKLGDPITVRIIDYDWSASEIYTLKSPPSDPLAMRMLSGTIRPSKGGSTSLVFASDFAMPTLSKPE